jgi:cell division protein FtsN
MPRLNLKDEGMEEEPLPLDSDRPISPPPTLRDVGGSSGGGGGSKILLVVAILVVLGAAVFALNYFKVIHLWGKKVPKTAEIMPDASVPENQTDQGMTPEGGQTTEPTTSEPTTIAPEPTPEPTSPVTKPGIGIPTSGSGNYTVQVSSWNSKAKADEEAARLNGAGLSAFVESSEVGGETWFRVRVGHYATIKEAREAAAQLSKMVEDGAWVTRVGG